MQTKTQNQIAFENTTNFVGILQQAGVNVATNLEMTTADNLRVLKSGDTMSGPLVMSIHAITGTGANSAGSYLASLTTESSSISTGAIVSAGGLGVAGNANIGGNALINGNVGIGTTTPNALLQFGNTLINRKIVLYDLANDDNQFSGFGVNSQIMRYQVNATASNHVFYAASSSSTSVELARITGTGSLRVSGTEASLSTSTGSITTSGGIGVAGSAYVGGNTITYGNLGVGITPSSAQIQLANTTVNRKLVLFDSYNTSHQFYGFGVNSGQTRYQVDATGSSHVFYAALTASSSAELARITGLGSFRVAGTETSVSTSTGSITTAGGLGVAGSANVGLGITAAGIIKTSNTTASSSVTSGALQSAGGLGVAGAAYIGLDMNVAGIMKTSNTTASSSITSGALQSSGGLGVAGSAYIGGTVYGKTSNPTSLGKYTCDSSSIVQNSTVETSMLTGTSSGSKTYPINTVNIGMMIRISSYFIFGDCGGTNSATFRLKTALGTLCSLVFLPSAGNHDVKIDMEVFVRGNAYTNMTLFSSSGVVIHKGLGTGNFPTTSANTLDVTAQWTNISVADHMHLERLVIENVYHE